MRDNDEFMHEQGRFECVACKVDFEAGVAYGCDGLKVGAG
jgi:hypothetical protein